MLRRLWGEVVQPFKMSARRLGDVGMYRLIPAIRDCPFLDPLKRLGGKLPTPLSELLLTSFLSPQAAHEPLVTQVGQLSQAIERLKGENRAPFAGRALRKKPQEAL